ncbi:ATP-grasp domain-containing protein [Fructilactobacillus carniphilus]|uniref:ATP-grasp domain-containing protein n=1 Tax=Fructilactobacillus carniphilus TaxID=2940297 RepID=A0ABY5BWT7_9LACO|nr:hypothetical protein [Fructilactobacillus carniphilus]USS90269.1 hypothetical protein M3M37_05350 [Fructilactobacillus carniphilus]
MKYFLYPYQPAGIELPKQLPDDLTVVVPEQQKERYEKYVTAASQGQIDTVASLDFAHLVTYFRKKQTQETISDIRTLAEDAMIGVGILKTYFCDKQLDSELSNLFFKDKYYMRSILQGIVPQPEFQAVSSFAQIKNFVEEHGQSVLKPRRADSATGVFVIEPAHLNEFADVNLGEDDYLIETFCPFNHMVTVDGYSVGNEIKLDLYHEYCDLILSTLTTRQNLCVRTSKLYFSSATWVPMIRKQLKEATQKILDVMTVTGETTPFHFEFFYGERGIMFCEVGKRFGGQGMIKLTPFEFGVSIPTAFWQDYLEPGTANLSISKRPQCIAGLLFVMAPPHSDRYQKLHYDWIKSIHQKKGNETATYQSTGSYCFVVEFTSRNEAEFTAHLQQLTKAFQ